MDARLTAVHNALSAVTTAGQAVAAADLCLGTLTTVRDQFSPLVQSLASWLTFGLYGAANPDRVDALAQLTGAITDVQNFRAPLAGDPSTPVVAGEGDWDNLFHAIERAYNVMYAIQNVQGDETEWQNFKSWVGNTVAGSVTALPGVISAAVSYAGSTATNLAGGTIAGVVAGFWPVLLIAGGVLVVAVLAVGPRGLAKAVA
jgi:hypothetical protein